MSPLVPLLTPFKVYSTISEARDAVAGVLAMKSDTLLCESEGTSRVLDDPGSRAGFVSTFSLNGFSVNQLIYWRLTPCYSLYESIERAIVIACILNFSC